MSHTSTCAVFTPLDIAILTVSDTRGLDEDGSGNLLADRLAGAGHRLTERALVPDDIYRIRAQVSAWVIRSDIQVVLVNGGTGFTARDNTPEALTVLFDKVVEGYGELFRLRSFEAIGTSTIQSRAVAGVIDRTLVFSMPGSPKACAMAWDDILAAQLDARTRPCNFVAMVVKDSQRCTSRSADHHVASVTGTTARHEALEVTP
ncbi:MULTISPECIES: molybdenum cofactor biosynthesis protein B [unclassified Halomonas]|uniref:molybdenum cofactor biosynthesis protein B n=1 Tax=unclassified Halomonas TaxID=2609666 RepID=UPI000C927349|nr:MULTISPECIES: molybdenum cofactor biosynthesis protein B [unclassified Halomonas]MBR9773112.1 molybdenum cofactor biosynthesis protein B [Gammaproteobacteria bacterium]MAR73465.1 molybdenum cofactor biosynthesis protein B [Halomonas sp.]MCJ8287617.1 molybdenum cofactor biosynthesis protein B [Halomonas sp.]NQY72339.1 molybdenum cofactor biosynthesis protein B [Halomonas sp.]RQW69780.1 molybdenum cofactor biosynthesis protein B [Halomonas sp. YLB-10]